MPSLSPLSYQTIQLCTVHEHPKLQQKIIPHVPWRSEEGHRHDLCARDCAGMSSSPGAKSSYPQTSRAPPRNGLRPVSSRALAFRAECCTSDEDCPSDDSFDSDVAQESFVPRRRLRVRPPAPPSGGPSRSVMRAPTEAAAAAGMRGSIPPGAHPHLSGAMAAAAAAARAAAGRASEPDTAGEIAAPPLASKTTRLNVATQATRRRNSLARQTALPVKSAPLQCHAAPGELCPLSLCVRKIQLLWPCRSPATT